MSIGLYKKLEAPVISEKASLISASGNAAVFKVNRSANKLDIKKAIEFAFNVKVDRVNIVNVKSKRKIFRGALGVRSGWKKAYIMLKPGCEIDLDGV